MKPVFYLAATYQLYFVITCLLIVLLRSGIYNFNHNSFLITKWFTQDSPSKWLLWRFLKLFLFTLLALACFKGGLVISDSDYFEKIQYVQPLLCIILGVGYLLGTFFTLCIGFECSFISKEHILEIIEDEK